MERRGCILGGGGAAITHHPTPCNHLQCFCAAAMLCKTMSMHHLSQCQTTTGSLRLKTKRAMICDLVQVLDKGGGCTITINLSKTFHEPCTLYTAPALLSMQAAHCAW